MPARRPFLAAALLTAAALAAPPTEDAARTDAPRAGGDTTLVIPRAQMSDRGAFSRPAPNLSLTRRGDHFAGNSFFQNAWVTAPASVAARDGLGPLFNTMSCQSCHVRDGRGRPPHPGEAMTSMLVRLSVPGDDSEADARQRTRGGVVPHPDYGGQLQSGAIAGVQPEARVVTLWTEHSGQYADGTPFRLRSPRYVLEQAAYGPPGDDLLLSGRVAPALPGVGLLDAIDVADLRALADPDDGNGDGISGRLNQVWDVTLQASAPGRFGWKAEQPNVRQQVAGAFQGDIGITSSLFPEDTLTASQRELVRAPHGGRPEVSDEILELVTFYCKTLAVPARRGHDDPLVQRGEALFSELGCSACHVDTFVTGDDPGFPELSGQTIHPYTDLLLHDMGPGLADDRPVFAASGREWRTPPLWGLGLLYLVNRHTDLLHDGRARDHAEAILWHGGEAQASRDRFVALDAADRRALVVFLKSL